MRAIAAAVLHLYPGAWRARYGDEMGALLADTGADFRVVFDLILGAMQMRLSEWPFLRLLPAFALVGMLVGFGVGRLIPPVYQSHATVRIVVASGGMLPSDALRHMQDDVKSRALLSQIIMRNDLKLYEKEIRRQPLEDVIEGMRKDTQITAVNLPGKPGVNSIAFDIGFLYGDAAKARLVVRALVQAFRERSKAMVSVDAFEVLDEASLPAMPVKPNIFAMSITGGIVGSLLACAAALRRRAASMRPMNAPFSSL